MIASKPLSNAPLDPSVVIPTKSPLNTSINKVSPVLTSTNFNNITPLAAGAKSTFTYPYTSAPEAFFGQNIFFSATIKAADGKGNPTGTVSLFDGDKQLGDPAKLNSDGTATFNIANLTIGTHMIKQAYSGDDTFATSNNTFPEIVNPARTNITINSSTTNPATVGQNITFTNKVNAIDAGAGTPTGAVTFYDGNNKLQDVTLDNQGVATFTTTLGVGKHNIREVYTGVGNFQSSETALDQTINNPLSGIKFDNAISANPVVVGQAVTFTSTITATDPNLGKPTGKVSFYDGDTLLKDVDLQDGVATYSTTLGLGTHSIKEIYSGDNNFASVTTDPIVETINKDSAKITTTALPDTSNPTSIILKTTVAGNAGVANPTGVVSFFEGDKKLGEANLDQGVASLKINLTPGKHTITEVYAGDNSFNTANGTLDATINANNAAITTTSSAATSTYGQNITFISTVTPGTTGISTPTGKVNFFDGDTLLSEGTLDAKGVASFTTNKLSTGKRNIKAVYAGDNNFLTITSTPLNETINPISTVITATTSNPTAIAGRNILFTSTVTNNSNSAGNPTGTVTLFDGTNKLGTADLKNGIATFNIANLGVGKHNITQTYTSSDGNFNNSTSAAIGETVVQGVFNIENYLNLLVDKGSNLIDLLFDEKYYLANNADVAAAVAKGQVKSGLDHFLKYGEAEGRDPSIIFSNSLYLIENPDVATAVNKKQFNSGLDHFQKNGLYERRDLRMLNFDEGWYLASNPDVKAAVDKGQYRYGYEHYLKFGQQEGRNPSPDFDEAYYLANNPDVKAAVAQGTYQSGFEHFAVTGRSEGRGGVAPIPA
ncbi:MAG: Ig-like domain repeat protein [Nostocaceae cyanobacterium]|nr:Ig-like domain repeat protein [Nostocaceae cyanobacterium]